jgi:hypothetical protein
MYVSGHVVLACSCSCPLETISNLLHIKAVQTPSLDVIMWRDRKICKVARVVVLRASICGAVVLCKGFNYVTVVNAPRLWTAAT